MVEWLVIVDGRVGLCRLWWKDKVLADRCVRYVFFLFTAYRRVDQVDLTRLCNGGDDDNQH